MYAHKHICRQGSFDIFDAEQGHYTRTIRQMQTNILSTTLDVDYIAYVYLEIKLTSIDTLAPGMEVFYIRNTDDGYKVVTGEISDKTADYILESKEREDVQALFATVEQKYDDALAKDEMLKEFDKKLEKAAKAKKEE